MISSLVHFVISLIITKGSKKKLRNQGSGSSLTNYKLCEVNMSWKTILIKNHKALQIIYKFDVNGIFQNLNKDFTFYFLEIQDSFLK